MITTESLERQLEIWKRFLWAGSAASVALLLTAIVERRHPPDFPGWYEISLILLIAITLSAGLGLLLAHSWRQLPIEQRLNTAFGYLGSAWTTLAAPVVRSVSQIPPWPIWR